MNGHVIIKRYLGSSLLSYVYCENVNSYSRFEDLYNRSVASIESEAIVLDRNRCAQKQKVLQIGGEKTTNLVVDIWRVEYTFQRLMDIVQSYRDCGLTPPSDFETSYTYEINWIHEDLPF